MMRSRTVQASVTAPGSDVARCAVCRSTLEFKTGEFGQTLERCRSLQLCPNRKWHTPIPDEGLAKPREPRKHKKREKKP